MDNIGNLKVLILAGGLGTRLQSVLNDLPKPMAPIKDKPFLWYVLNYLSKMGVKTAYLSVGYRYESIIEYFGSRFEDIELNYVIEEKPLGTGGGIKAVLEKIADHSNVLVMNGDTFFPVNINNMYNDFFTTSPDLMIAVKEMYNYDRYGSINLDGSRIIGFIEKMPRESGYISGGVYLFKRELLRLLPQQEVFSFEKDFLEKNVNKLFFESFKSNAPFLDIGVPEDYKRAEAFFMDWVQSSDR